MSEIDEVVNLQKTQRHYHHNLSTAAAAATTSTIRMGHESTVVPTVEHVESEGAMTLSAHERKLVRKIDWFVLPWLCVLSALAQIDRVNISSAKVAGMAKALDLTGNRYSVALLVFFPTYVLSELPANVIIKKVGVRSFLTTLVVGWGTLSMCHGFVNTYRQLCVVRVLLGLFEGGFNRGSVYIISCWYKRYEVQQRLAIWFMSGATIAGFQGILSYGLSQMDGLGGLECWRWIFIVPGALTVTSAIPMFLFVSEFPEKAHLLQAEELEMVRERLAADRHEVLAEEVTRASVGAAVSDWKVWVLSVLLVFPAVGAYAMAFFMATILKSFGYSVALSQILTTPPYLLACIISIAIGVWADRIHVRGPFVIGLSVLAMVGYALMGWGPNTGAQLVGAFFALACNYSCIPTLLAHLSNNVVGVGKRAIAVPMQII
ncbi:hypothetical protein H2200_007960 [Cladophialophora chaetospira]|uniref:Major facilitator superfamily (MFS) profile domain-containing protein n=1 Tax=Cladophialophora chaetospira TaxID=386627 RepID=A0AA38X6U9_9EURO|nr:hypothetical protein H2200_007960 [Cladophialophora chaetospira]